MTGSRRRSKDDDDAASERRQPDDPRDFFATDRTVMANERTLLSYVPTFLPLTIAGLTLGAMVDHPFLRTLGWVSIPVTVVMMVGAGRFMAIRRGMANVPHDPSYFR